MENSGCSSAVVTSIQYKPASSQGQWIYVPLPAPPGTSVIVGNLDEGSYTFRVLVTNNEGLSAEVVKIGKTGK